MIDENNGWLSIARFVPAGLALRTGLPPLACGALSLPEAVNKSVKRRKSSWRRAQKRLDCFNKANGENAESRALNRRDQGMIRIALLKRRIKKDRIRFLYSVQGNGSWERAVR
ncbi:hypothetical protein [Franconibacter daqui]|uniref:hypothetical protein n=1 Tax=Franconibacter daqui TaxID=2047724 RepID=UPI002DB7E9E8|nr:hypothetical protein [Franconibacter daqui]MEB5922819.1 hypothetical protein [Franconibacter daqui]